MIGGLVPWLVGLALWNWDTPSYSSTRGIIRLICCTMHPCGTHTE